MEVAVVAKRHKMRRQEITNFSDRRPSVAGMVADGTGPTGVPDGEVDQLDYNFWKANFSSHSGSSARANAAVPEPATQWMLLTGILTMCGRRRPKVP